jgi:hypothetical protein
VKLTSTIDRRLLVNWRADPDVVQRLLPEPMRPTLVAGSAVVGVCVVRLKHAKPARLPVPGLTSDGIAHRVGVEWDTPDGLARGVFIWQRHTNSVANRVLGGRVFPGVHQPARFSVKETRRRLAILVPGIAEVSVTVGGTFDSKVFRGLDEASEFFERAPLGISPGHAGNLESIRLVTNEWVVEPAALECARSTFYENARSFPAGSVIPDSAMLMRNVAAEWIGGDVVIPPWENGRYVGFGARPVGGGAR